MYQKTSLDNGLRILTARMPHTPSVSLGVFIGTGSRYEDDEVAGISHFIEHLCFKGTRKRPTSNEISEAIEGVGGLINAGTDKELTVYGCKVARPHFPIAIDVLADMLLNSRFAPQDIETERQVIIEEIKLTKDSPPQRVGLLADDLLWPNHPLGRDIAGSEQSMNSINRETILSNFKSHYLPTNTVISVAGDISHQEVVSSLGQTLGNWTNKRPNPSYQPYQEKEAPRLCIETKDTEQAHLCLALPGLALPHPERFTLSLLNVILGEGMSSRLFIEIRDRLGLTYSIHSFVDHFLDSGSIAICASVEPKNLKQAIRAILEEVSKLREKVSESELAKAKEFSKGRLLLRLEDSRSVSNWVGAQELLLSKVLEPEEVIAIIDAITTDEITKLAQELFVSQKLRLAVVGPISDQEPLEELLKL